MIYHRVFFTSTKKTTTVKTFRIKSRKLKAPYRGILGATSPYTLLLRQFYQFNLFSHSGKFKKNDKNREFWPRKNVEITQLVSSLVKLTITTPTGPKNMTLAIKRCDR